MNDVLKDFPSIEIISTADAAWLKANAENKFDSILSIYEDIDLVFAQNDPMAAYISYRWGQSYSGGYEHFGEKTI